MIRLSRLGSLAIVLLLVAILASPALAQEKKGNKKGARKGGGATAQFAKMDTDKNGEVTLEEFLKANPKLTKEKATARFEKMAKGNKSFNVDDLRVFLKTQEKKDKDKDKEKNDGV
jgi:hypothetical protein